MKTDVEAVKDADKWNREAGRIERAESKRLNKEKGFVDDARRRAVLLQETAHIRCSPMYWL